MGNNLIFFVFNIFFLQVDMNSPDNGTSSEDEDISLPLDPEADNYDRDDDEPFSDKEDDKKSVRGPTKMIKLIKNRCKGKISLEHNKYGQIIKDEGINYQSYLGVLARREIPLCFRKCRLVPQKYKDSAWFQVTVIHLTFYLSN